jgi:glycosyltransferase involved in cell wall biosynthesis
MLISVVIPFYNSEKYISETIRSVINQTYSDFEIICVDNNSSDNSAQIVTKLISDNPEKKIILIKELRKGANYARNTGLLYAKGELVQFLDADDMLRPEKFLSQVRGFVESPNIDMVVSDRVSMNEDLTKTLYHHDFSSIEKKPLNTVISRIIITGNPIYKKEFLKKIGAWDVSLPNAQDWELNIRAVLRRAVIRYVKGEYLVSRGVADSLSANWINVSITSAAIIENYYGEILRAMEKLDSYSMKKIFYVFYLSALHSESSRGDDYCRFITTNIINWRSYIKHPLKKIIAYLSGIKGLVRLEKKYSKD